MQTFEDFLKKNPPAVLLCDVITERICSELKDVKIKQGKTQISLSNKYGFAYIWFPPRKMKGRPELYIIVSFGLGQPLTNPRIVEVIETYPGRWMHHVIIQNEEEIDDQLMGWIRAAYEFAMRK